METPSGANPPLAEVSCSRLILDLLSQAGRDPGLSPPVKAVLLAVVAYADRDGLCRQPDESLARASRTSIPTVQRALKHFEKERVLRRSCRLHEARVIQLLTEDQHLAVVVEDFSKKEQQQQDFPDCSPGSMEEGEAVGDPSLDLDGKFEGLMRMMIAFGVTRRIARGLARNYPDRIAAQVEAHRRRNVSNPAGSLVVAIREDWPTQPPTAQRQPNSRERAEEARKVSEAERRAILHEQGVENARRRAEDEQVWAFWDALTECQQDAFDEEAIEASPHRDTIRNLGPGAPLFRGFRAAARWEQVRRRLGLEVRD